MVFGVNGGGKKTFTGKISYILKKEGIKVLMVVGDTLQATARVQNGATTWNLNDLQG